MKLHFYIDFVRNNISCGIILACFCMEAVIKVSGQTMEWKIFTTANSGIANNTVFVSEPESNGSKWIGTNNGLSSFDGTTWTTYLMSNSGLPANIVSSLMIENPEKIWIGTNGIFTQNGGGLAIFDSSSWLVYNPSNSSFPDDQVTAIVMDKKGNKWIGTDNGLVKYNGTTWTVLPSGWTTYYASVSALVIDKDTDIWIGTGYGLSHFDNVTWNVYTTGNSGLQSNNIWALAEDTLGNTWVGTNDGGLAKFDGTNWTVYETSNSGLPVNDVTSLAIDKNNTIWIGTWNGGLVSLHDTTWTVYDSSNSKIPSNIIYSVAIDKFGNKWLGTTAGLAVFNKGGILGIGNNAPGFPGGNPASLEQNNPNPFVSVTELPFTLKKQGNVTLSIVNILGEEIARPVNEFLPDGKYSIPFDGASLTPGIYMYILRIDDLTLTRRMVRGR
jgi:ligand-binding sensor domain-containing protein